MVPQGTAAGESRRGWWVAALIGALLLVWLAWSQGDRLRGLLSGSEAPDPAPAGSSPAVAAQAPARETPTADWFGRTPRWPADFTDPQSCEAVESELARICAALDRAAEGEEGTCAMISEVAAELAQNPPVLSSELKSYAAILSNAFHLFRVLGRDRVDLLRARLSEQDELSEPVAMALYRWLITRERCARSGGSPIGIDALYAYSGFLFRTLGGQAYLRRRTPRTEALASFYALLILDRAQERNHNPQGLDPRAEILRTRSLLQTQPLVFADGYRNVLDEMEARWRRRTGS